MASALRIARAEALRTARETRLVLDLAARRYSADGIAAPRAIPRDVSIVYEVPAARANGEHTAEIRFRPDGSSSGGTIRIASARATALVEVDWLTGRTHIDWRR
jgi:general secretion pathway protein H